MAELVAVALLLAAVAAIFMAFQFRKRFTDSNSRLAEMQHQYAPIIDANAELAQIRAEIERFSSAAAETRTRHATEIADLQKNHAAATKEHADRMADVRQRHAALLGADADLATILSELNSLKSQKLTHQAEASTARTKL